MMGRVPRYSNAFWIPAAFCCTTDDTVLAAFSAHPMTVPKPELSSLRPELTPLNALFHPDFTVLATFPAKFHTPEPELLLPVLFQVTGVDDEETIHDELFQ